MSASRLASNAAPLLISQLQLDPSTHGGYKTIFFRDVPLELRLQTTDAAPAEAGTLEAISCKVLIKEGEDGRPRAVKVELSSEGDLFFHYTHVVDERQFNAMRDEQKLMVDFAVRRRKPSRNCSCLPEQSAAAQAI